MYGSCDYVMDTKHDFFFIKGYCHPNNGVYGIKAFQQHENGVRLNRNGLRYDKIYRDILEVVSEEHVLERFKPRECETKHKLQGIWKKIFDAIQELGVPEKDIGIFGSVLIGFPIVEDVDFVIYGLDNLKKIKNNIDALRLELGVTGISDAHVQYHSEKYSKDHNSEYTNFEKLLRNKWSSLQIKEGLLTTLRFGLNEHEISDLFRFDPAASGQDITLKGEVIDDALVDLCPRIFTLADADTTYTVATHYWAYQSCVKKGDVVRVRGELVEDRVILNKYDHGIWLM